MDCLRDDYRNLHPMEKWLDWKALPPNNIIKKILCFRGGDWWFNCSWHRTLPTVWRNFILQNKIENVLWHINNIVLPKSIRSVVIHCGTNSIDTSSSDEINLGVVTIARSISPRYPNIEVIVSDLLPRNIHWSTWRVKINKTNDYLRDYCKNKKKWLSCTKTRTGLCQITL